MVAQISESLFLNESSEIFTISRINGSCIVTDSPEHSGMAGEKTSPAIHVEVAFVTPSEIS